MVRDSTHLFLGGGNCSAIRVGRVNFTPDQLADNIMAAVKGAMSYISDSWAGVERILIKTEDSLALPIWPDAIYKDQAQ